MQPESHASGYNLGLLYLFMHYFMEMVEIWFGKYKIGDNLKVDENPFLVCDTINNVSRN
jgi:hypothetical protein